MVKNSEVLKLAYTQLKIQNSGELDLSDPIEQVSQTTECWPPL
jgi:hypothetical protein